MKKYVFRLETVRRVRHTQEEQAKSALLRANSEVQEAINAVESSLQSYEQRSGESLTMGGSSVNNFMKQRYFNELAGRAVLQAQRARLEAEEVAAAKRALYLEAAKKVKALDRLDTRRREEFRVEYGRELDKELDDIVVGRAARMPGRS